MYFGVEGAEKIFDTLRRRYIGFFRPEGGSIAGFWPEGGGSIAGFPTDVQLMNP